MSVYIHWHGLESTFYSTCLITKCICNRGQFFINLYKNQENVYCRGYKARWKQRNALNFWAINFVLFKQFVSLSLNYVSSLFFCVSLYSLSLLYSKCAKTEFCNLRRCFILFLVLTSTSNPTWICWQEDIKPWMKFKHINLYFTFLFLTRNVKFFAVLIILLEIRKISFIYIRIFTWMMYFEKIYWYNRSIWWTI